MPGDRGTVPPLSTLVRIAKGASAEIFALPDGAVLKLFYDGADRTAARREIIATRLAHRAGLAVPRPRYPARVEGRVGLVVDRVEGMTALAALRTTPWRMFGLLRALARYQAAAHAVRVAADVLPDLHEATAARIGWSQASPAQIAAAHAALAALPRGDGLCHGDLHPDNLILSPGGLVSIDWSQATRGAPAADVARTELLLRYAAYGRHLRRFAPLRVVRHLSGWWYRRCYARAADVPAATIDAWRLPIAAAWLTNGSVAFAPGLRAMIARAVRDADRTR